MPDADLTPTPGLLAVARRLATGDWTVAHDENPYTDMDPDLRALVDLGYVVLYMPPTRLRLDYWTLTSRGRKWLARHDAEQTETP